MCVGHTVCQFVAWPARAVAVSCVINTGRCVVLTVPVTGFYSFCAALTVATGCFPAQHNVTVFCASLAVTTVCVSSQHVVAVSCAVLAVTTVCVSSQHDVAVSINDDREAAEWAGKGARPRRRSSSFHRPDPIIQQKELRPGHYINAEYEVSGARRAAEELPGYLVALVGNKVLLN